MLSVRAMLLIAMLTGGAGSFVPATLQAATSSVQQKAVLKGRVTDTTGEPAVGAYVIVVGAGTGTTTTKRSIHTQKCKTWFYHQGFSYRLQVSNCEMGR